MRLILSLALMLVLIAGCGSQQDEEQAQTEAPKAAIDSTEHATRTSTRHFRGIIYFSPRFRVFRDLDSARAYWVADPDEFIVTEYMAAAYGPEAPVWAEVSGTVTAFDGLGIAADFDSLLTVSTVTDLSGKTEIEPPMFKAAGNEPFWSITTTPGGGLSLRRPEDLEPIEFKGPQAVGKPDAWIFMGRQHIGSPTTLQLILTREPCQDTMADKEWTWRAMAIMDRTVLRGCAEEIMAGASSD